MTDDSGRRQRRQFEPPPWERDKFEEIARRRAEDEEREAQRQAPRSEDAGPDRPVETAAVEPPARVAGVEPESGGVDERKIAAMLIELSGEEGSATKPVTRAARYVAIAMIVLGGAMIVTAAVLGSRTSAAQGHVGARMIALVGASVAGFAGWMWVRASREQGS